MPDKWEPSTFSTSSADADTVAEDISAIMAEGFKTPECLPELRLLPLDELIQRIRLSSPKSSFAQAEWAVHGLYERGLLWMMRLDDRYLVELPDGTETEMSDWVVYTEMRTLVRRIQQGDHLPSIEVEVSEPQFVSVGEYEEHLRRALGILVPPAAKVSTAMLDLAEMLAGISRWALGRREEGALVRECDRQYGHKRAATLWAILEHLKAGRIRIQFVDASDEWLQAFIGSSQNETVDWSPRDCYVIEPEKGLERYWHEQTAVLEEPVDSGDGRAQEDQSLPDPITLEQAAKLLGLKKKTLSNRFSRCRPPQPAYKGRGRKCDVWRYSELRPWLAQNWPDEEPKLPAEYKPAKRRSSES